MTAGTCIDKVTFQSSTFTSQHCISRISPGWQHAHQNFGWRRPWYYLSADANAGVVTLRAITTPGATKHKWSSAPTSTPVEEELSTKAFLKASRALPSLSSQCDSRVSAQGCNWSTTASKERLATGTSMHCVTKLSANRAVADYSQIPREQNGQDSVDVLVLPSASVAKNNKSSSTRHFPC